MKSFFSFLIATAVVAIKLREDGNEDPMDTIAGGTAGTAGTAGPAAGDD